MDNRKLLYIFNRLFQITWISLCVYLISISWGQPRIEIDSTKEFETISKAFEDYGKLYINPNYKLPPMKISFTNISQSIYSGLDQGELNTIGICLPDGKGSHHILIDRKFWNKASTQKKELLIFHELGHCALNRDHDSRIFCNHIDYSIMNPTLIHGFDYQNNKEHYLRDLFQSTYKDNLMDILTNKADAISCMPEMSSL